MNRREFLKTVSKILIAVGGAHFFTYEELLALESGEIQKPDLIWIHAMSCDGCTISLLNSEVPMLDILTKFTNVIFHPTIMASTGEDALRMLEEYKSDNLIMVLEGSIPLDMPHACVMGERFIEEWVYQIAQKSNLAIGAGTCAVFNGITEMHNMCTGTSSFKYFLENRNIKIPIVNLPTCPMKPHHFLYTLFHYIKHKTTPPLDMESRPLRFFSNNVHERCVYYYDFQEKIFAKKIGDRGCLFKLGCQGPVTKNDCIQSEGHFDRFNCIKSGHPCVGCGSENFPRNILFRRSDDKRIIKKYKNFKRI